MRVDWKTREKEQRSNDIIDVAQKLFFDKCYESVSMDEIAKEAELGKGTLYLYFKNKESLFYAVALRGMRILNSMHAGCLDLDTNGVGKLHAMTRGYFEFTQEYPEYFLMLCHAAANPSSRKNDEYVKKFNELAVKNVQVISKVLEEGVAEGKIRKDLNPYEIAIFLSVIGISIMNMDPVWKAALENIGSGKDQTWDRYVRFITPAIETHHKLDLDKNNPASEAIKPLELKNKNHKVTD